jgi:hypothetical protein
MKGTGGSPELAVAAFRAVVHYDIDALRAKEYFEFMYPLRSESAWSYNEVR